MVIMNFDFENMKEENMKELLSKLNIEQLEDLMIKQTKRNLELKDQIKNIGEE